MADYRDQLPVSAPADEVYRIMAAVERWPELTPSVRKVTKLDGGPLVEGTRVRIHQPRLLPQTWTVTQVVPDRSFIWTARSVGVHSTAGHGVEPVDQGTGDDSGTSLVTLTIRQVGPLAGLIGLLYGRLVRRYLRLELQGFKRQAESRRVDSSESD